MEVKISLFSFVVTMTTKWVSFLCFLGGLIQEKKSQADLKDKQLNILRQMFIFVLCGVSRGNPRSFILCRENNY